MLKPYNNYKETSKGYHFRIPSHWQEIPNRSLMTEIVNYNTDDNAVLLSLSQYTGITLKDLKNKIGMTFSDSLIGYKIVKPNNIVMNIMLAWNGSTACSNYEGVISPAYAVFKVHNEDALPMYLHYLFRIEPMCIYYKAYSTGIIDSRLRLYPNIFKSLYSILPPKEEQNQIVRYLDWKTSEIDRFIHQKKKQIKKLEELRRKKNRRDCYIWFRQKS